VYDTHELETETVKSKGLRRMIGKAIERTLIRAADAVVVVGDLIGDWYRRAYGIGHVHVIRNLPEAFRGTEGSSDLFQKAFGLRDRDQLFLYHGIIGQGRGVGLLVEAFRQLPGHQHLIFLGYGPLTDLVQDYARRHRNIHFHPAVPPKDLLAYSMSAHIGLAVIENTCQSYYYCLPNKLFEYLQCGLPVIVSDFPEMASIVDRHQCGWKVRVSVEDVVDRIRAITEDELAAKRTAAFACRELFTWERESVKLEALYRRLFPTRMRQAECPRTQKRAA
jgi:glycosyltransferase involved in cell wall biosynthesis